MPAAEALARGGGGGGSGSAPPSGALARSRGDGGQTGGSSAAQLHRKRTQQAVRELKHPDWGSAWRGGQIGDWRGNRTRKNWSGRALEGLSEFCV